MLHTVPFKITKLNSIDLIIMMVIFETRKKDEQKRTRITTKLLKLKVMISGNKI